MKASSRLNTKEIEEIEEELRDQAARRGQGLPDFAAETARDLAKLEREAAQITDEEARLLLIRSRIDHFLPKSVQRMEKRLQNKGGGHTGDPGALQGVLYQLLSILYGALAEGKQVHIIKGDKPGPGDVILGPVPSGERSSWPLSETQSERLDYTATELMVLPLEKRHAIMRAQAASMAPLYAADLALSPEERELTAFTSLNNDPFLEPEEYLIAADK